MYFVSTIHPHLKETEDPKYNGDWLTIEGKRNVVNKFYKQKRELPLCIDHCNANQGGFFVPYDQRIGKVLDLLIDENGDLIAKGLLFEDDEHYPEIAQGIIARKEKWGVSVWMDIDSGNGKDLTHVALTLNPYLKDYNSYIHQYSHCEEAIDNVIVQYYYNKSKGHCYISNQFKQKLEPKILEYENHLIEKEKKLNLEKMSNSQAQQQESASLATTTTNNENASSSNAIATSKEVANSSSSFTQQEPFRFSNGYDEAIKSNDIAKIKEQLSIMDKYMDKNKLPWGQQDRVFKSKYNELEKRKEDALKAVVDNLKFLHQEHDLPGEVAEEYLKLYNSNDMSDSRPITTYVAASYSAYTAKQRELDKAREQLKSIETEKNKFYEESTKYQRENEELKRMKTSQSGSYSTTSSKSYLDYDRREKERNEESASSSSSDRHNLLSAFKKENTRPLDAWIGSYMVPKATNIFDSYVQQRSFETDEQGIGNLKKMGAFMSQGYNNPKIYDKCGINVTYSYEDLK